MARLKLKYFLVEDCLDLPLLSKLEISKIRAIDELLEINFNFPFYKTSGVYKILFPDGYFYIGKSTNIVKRIWGHLSDAPFNDKPLYKKLLNSNKSEIIILKISQNIDEEKEIILKESSEFMLNIMWNNFNKI